MCTSNLKQIKTSFIFTKQGHSQMTSWIGLTNEGSGYQWLDGSTDNSFYNWDTTAQKSQKCVHADKYGLWKDESCDKQFSYICKKEDS